VNQFHNPDDEPNCSRVITIPINDNHKYTIAEYRDRLYQEIVKKKKELRRKIKEKEERRVGIVLQWRAPGCLLPPHPPHRTAPPPVIAALRALAGHAARQPGPLSLRMHTLRRPHGAPAPAAAPAQGGRLRT
jgi:hypothetical protein